MSRTTPDVAREKTGMLTKNDLRNSLLHECDVCKHLFTKLPEGGLDYRQCETQRSNLELLRYISFCGIGGMCAVVDGNWDGYREWAETAAELSADEFPAAMDRQKEAIREKFAALSDEDLEREVKLPMGDKKRLACALLEIPLKWMVGYRMQLFLGVKAAGNEEIWTPDCWAGVSMPRESAPAS